MTHWNGPLIPLPKLCRHQLRDCISSRASTTFMSAGPFGYRLFPVLLPSWMLSVPSGPSAPSSLHKDAGSLQPPQSSAGAAAPRAARLGKEAEKVAPQRSAPAQSTAALCKAVSSTLR